MGYKSLEDVPAALEELSGSASLDVFREMVRPLQRYDRERGSDLVRTLRAFFAANGNASEAAERLFLHRNSFSYRLDRVEGLTGLDLKDHRVRLALQLGLLATDEEE